MKKVLITFLLCSSFGFINAQDDLTLDQNFFEEKANLYQDWLDNIGVGTYMKYRELYVNTDTLFFYLEFLSEDLQYNISAWTEMKMKFEKDSPLKFEEQLYYKYLFMMELRPSQGNIQLYDTYNLEESPLFARIIYYDDKADTVAIEENNPKGQDEKINIAFKPGLEPNARSSVEAFHSGMKEELFDKILDFSRQELIKPNGRGGQSQFYVREKGENLVIEVSDLSKEILVDASNSVLCELANRFGIKCYDITREKLQISFGYQALYDNKARVDISIDGMFASGSGSAVKRGAYKDMELDPRFRTYLELYADQFKIKLEDYLKQNR